MRKNEGIYEMPLSKKEFVDIINRLQTATDLVDKVVKEHGCSRSRFIADAVEYGLNYVSKG